MVRGMTMVAAQGESICIIKIHNLHWIIVIESIFGGTIEIIFIDKSLSDMGWKITLDGNDTWFTIVVFTWNMEESNTNWENFIVVI